MKLKKVKYGKLNSKQRESYNFQKLSAVLADYGFTTYRMHDDLKGADFFAIGTNGDILKVQLKGRFVVDRKYLGKDILMGFPDGDQWYLYPHDQFYDLVIKRSKGAASNERRSFPSVSKWIKPHLEEFKL